MEKNTYIYNFIFLKRSMGTCDEVPKDTGMGIHAYGGDAHAWVYGVGFIHNIDSHP